MTGISLMRCSMAKTERELLLGTVGQTCDAVIVFGLGTGTDLEVFEAHLSRTVDNDIRRSTSYRCILLLLSELSPPSPISSRQLTICRSVSGPLNTCRNSQSRKKKALYPRDSSAAHTQHHVCGKNPRRSSAIYQRAQYGSLASITTTPSWPCAHSQSKLLWLHCPGRIL